METLFYTPTVNEIAYRREEAYNMRRTGRAERCGNRYNVDDTVEFIFSGVKKMGRVTTVLCDRSKKVFYNINAITGQWFRGISQEDVVRKVDADKMEERRAWL